MNKLTTEEILATIDKPRTNTNNVVIYSNSDSEINLNRNLKENLNRFQHQDIENHVAPEALLFPAKPLVREDQRKTEKSGETGRGFRRISTQELYTEIGVQINRIRTQGRYNRANIYISIKEQNDNRYSIFLSGAATNCMTELVRGAKQDKTVLDIIDTFAQEHKGCMIGRLHYKAPRGIKTTNFHRKLLRHALVALYTNEHEELEAELYLLDEWYKIPLNSELTEKQRQLFAAAGIWRDELEQFNDDEELA